jgi:hypothetical protein
MAILEVETLEVQRGIWIDERWLQNAGLGKSLRVVVQPGAVHILPGLAKSELLHQEPAQEPSALGWEIFRALGDDAQPGRLPDAARDHDRYLYRKT